MMKTILLLISGVLVLGLAFTAGLLSRGDSLGDRAPTINNPFIVPFPEDRMSDRGFEVIARRIIAEDLALTAGGTSSFDTTLPQELLGEETFVSVTARVKVREYSRRLLVVSDGQNVAQSAPLFGSEEWQTVTVVFPFRLSKPDFTIAVDRSHPVELEELVFLAVVDDRYARDVCSEADGLVGHERRRYTDYHETLSYRKVPGRLRVVLVGNSTIDGCKVSRGATPSYVLQQKLEALYPGRFEVMNAGLAGASYVAHIASITTYYPLPQQSWPSVERAARYQNKQPSIADLAPDILVLAVHWNDLSDFEFLAYGGEEPVEGQLRGNPSYADRALEAFFAVLDEPSGPNLVRLLASYRTMTSQPPVLGRWKQYARSHYRRMTEQYIDRLAQYSPETEVVLLTLPNDKDTGDATRFEADIQRNVYVEVAAEREIALIDLAGSFHERFPERSTPRMQASAYLFDDAIHFSYRGNQWLADRIAGTIVAVGGGEIVE